MKKLLLFFSFLMLISCSKKNVEEESDVTLVNYQLSIFASEGGTVSYDNPNNGLFSKPTTGSRDYQEKSSVDILGETSDTQGYSYDDFEDFENKCDDIDKSRVWQTAHLRSAKTIKSP